jgi:hypothetical protein
VSSRISPTLWINIYINPHQTYSLLRYPKASLPSDVAAIMLHATNDERGTVAGLASLSQDLDEEYADGASCLSLIPGHWYDPLVRDRIRAICSQPTTPEQSHAI